MADLSIKYGLKKDLPQYSAELEGALLITTDERAVYANIGGSQFRIGDFQVVAKVSDLPSPADAGTQLFFILATNALAVSNGSQWIQVNTDTDTGATSIGFEGGSGEDGAPASGEFISGVRYNAEQRKLIFSVTKLTANIVAYGDSTVRDALDNRTVQVLNGANGTARIFNESDGGGAQFTHSDGTRSFAGVNDGGKNGITGQLYSVDTQNENLGTRLNMTNNGFFYTNGKKSALDYTADDELATKGDVRNAGQAGNVHLADESSGQSDYAKVYKIYQGADAADMTKNTLVGTINIPKDLVVKSGAVREVTVADTPYPGAAIGDKYIDLEIQNQTEHLYIPAKDLVDIYTGGATATVSVTVENNQITATIVAGSVGLTELSTEVKNIINNKTDHVLQGTNGRALMFNESDGGGAKFEHTDGTMSFVGVNDGGENGITGQVYSVKKNAETGKNVGTRINMTTDGFFYTSGKDSASYTANDEIATKGDIENSRIVWGTFK